MKLNIKYTILYALFAVAVIISACERLVEVDVPPTSTSTDVIFSSDASAAAVMTSIYAQMNAGLTGLNSISVYPELSADNLTLFAINNTQYLPFYKNELSPFSTSAPNYWNIIYSLMYNVNATIEEAGKSANLTPALKEQLVGEAYFMRGFFYYYLINLYGDVPLVISTSYNETMGLGRTAVTKIYDQIIADLIQASQLLNESYLDGTLIKTTADRLRPNKYAAYALLARVYLFKGDYTNAEVQATKVISLKALYDIIPPADVFLKNSKETIWSLQPVKTGENTPEARFYVLPATGPNLSNNPVYLADRLINAFEAGDLRKTTWTSSIMVSGGATYPYAAKYKIITQNAAVNEFSIVLRLAEQYLIRAEARAQLVNIAGAQADLNTLRLRAGLNITNAATKDDLIAAIFKERRVELFTEWGHRWFDLKRSGKIDEIMTPVTAAKGGIWKSDWQLYPVPALERQNNPALSQNNGYPQ